MEKLEKTYPYILILFGIASLLTIAAFSSKASTTESQSPARQEVVKDSGSEISGSEIRITRSQVE